MSVQRSLSSVIEERIRLKMNWYRVPLMTLVFLALMMFMRERAAFWWGVPVALFGECLQLWAASQLHKDRRVICSGPYAHVRNPMYIGRFFLGLGFVIMTWNLFLIVGYVLVYAGYARGRVLREEERLEGLFGEDYLHYCREVPRWFPQIKPYSKSEPGQTSLKQALYNHEHLNLLGLIVVLFLIALRIDCFPDWPPFLR